MSQAKGLFPSIGSVADQADHLPDHEETNGSSVSGISDNATEELDDKPTQEIESLCMKCGEQVSRRPNLLSTCNDLTAVTSRASPGCS
jgi:zinc finger protein